MFSVPEPLSTASKASLDAQLNLLRAAGMSYPAMSETFRTWSDGVLDSFLDLIAPPLGVERLPRL